MAEFFGVFRLEMGNKNTDFKAPPEKFHAVSLLNLLALQKKAWIKIPSSPIWNPHSLSNPLQTSKMGPKAADQLHALVPAQFQFASLLVAPSVAARDWQCLSGFNHQPPNWTKKKLLLWWWRPQHKQDPYLTKNKQFQPLRSDLPTQKRNANWIKRERKKCIKCVTSVFWKSLHLTLFASFTGLAELVSGHPTTSEIYNIANHELASMDFFRDQTWMESPSNA